MWFCHIIPVFYLFSIYETQLNVSRYDAGVVHHHFYTFLNLIFYMDQIRDNIPDIPTLILSTQWLRVFR